VRPGAGPPVPRLRLADLLPVGSLGLRTRRLRAALSALGIAIGIAAIVAVVGITSSSQASLLAQIDRLGTNLLTVANGQTVGGGHAELPVTAVPMITRMAGVEHVTGTATLAAAAVYRSDKVPAYDTRGLAVTATGGNLLATLNSSLRAGRFLNRATERANVTVLGYSAAQGLGISAAQLPARVWISGTWFDVVGILNPLPLAPTVDRSALIGDPAAAADFGYDGHPSYIYVRAGDAAVTQVAALLAATVNPADPEQVTVSRPSDALAARAAVATSGTTLYLGLGAVALLVGGIGIANVMVISVLERRGEIGLRRALGAAGRHIAAQFLTEALLLAIAGGALGLLAGTASTAVVARASHWTLGIPLAGLYGAFGVAIAIGALAGLYPAMRAARLSPTEALRGST
jgi:putative ABC transport system permease protein